MTDLDTDKLNREVSAAFEKISEDSKLEPWEKLVALVEQAGAVITLDYQASTALPCFLCGSFSKVRRLFVVGHHTKESLVGTVGHNVGDRMYRPVCFSCEP